VVAFVTTLMLGLAATGLIFRFGARRTPGTPLTWGEAMAAAAFSFFLMFWFYGVIPHQWLTVADSELGWRSDKILGGPFGLLEKSAWQPMTFSFKVLRDIIATLIYIVGLGYQIFIWTWWNNRGKAKPADAPASRYGRPLVRAN
jgi:hypothetical protein